MFSQKDCFACLMNVSMLSEEEEAEQNKLSELIVQLRARTNQQQDELRSLNRDARQKSADFEAVSS